MSMSLMAPSCLCLRITDNPFFLASIVALWVSPATVHRLEMAEQKVTLKTLEQLIVRLKCSISDVFPEK